MKRALAAALAAGALALACGGGGGGGGGGGPTVPPPSILFTPSADSSSATLVLVEAGGGSPTLLRLNLDARLVSGLYGVAFDLTYPSDVLSIVSVTEGSFFGGGGGTTLQVNSTNPGRLIIGLSRLGSVGGVTGSGTLLTVELSSKGAAGGGTLAFERNFAYDSAAKAISGTTWSGGSVSVTP